MDDQPTISTHILDTEHGWPAKGVTVKLFRIAPGGDRPAGEAATDDDGRVRRLLDGELQDGDYRIEFSLGGPFFGSVTLTFHVGDTSHSYHVPLLIAPFSITSYRGS